MKISNIIRRGALVVAVAAASIGLVAGIAPSEASAASRGTVTKTEGRKVIKQGDRQKCLTYKEVKKIVHGTGTRNYNQDGFQDYTWKGGKGVRELSVGFYDGCAYFGYLEYKNWNSYSFYGDQGFSWDD